MRRKLIFLMQVKSVRQTPAPAGYWHSLVQGRWGAMMLTRMSVLFSDTTATVGTTVALVKGGEGVTEGGCGEFREGKLMAFSVVEGKIIRSLDKDSKSLGSSGEGNAIGFTLGSISSGGKPGEEDGKFGAEEDEEERTRRGERGKGLKGVSTDESEGRGEEADEGEGEETAEPLSLSFPPSPSPEAE